MRAFFDNDSTICRTIPRNDERDDQSRHLGCSHDIGHGDSDHRRIAQAEAFRCSAGGLHVCDALRRLRYHISVFNVASTAADCTLLAARLAGLLSPKVSRTQPGELGWTIDRRIRVEQLHLQARAHSLGSSLVDHVGLSSGDRNHLPAGLWLDSFRDGARRFEWYRTYVFGFPTFSFPVHSLAGFLIFHGLVWSSFLVIAGVMLAMRRRMRDHGAAAAQQFAEDFLPLILLFAISVTGLMLTASYTWMRGYGYDFLAIAARHDGDFHLALAAVRQVLPHLSAACSTGSELLQRRRRARRTGQMPPLRSGPLRSRMHVEDLIEVEKQLGFRYEMEGNAEHYQCICPRCRRVNAGIGSGTIVEFHEQVRSDCDLYGRSLSKRLSNITDQFGPHLAFSSGCGLKTSVVPDKIVKTHCCFCGQQCGIQLKVKDNAVIGFEPWEDFPFNQRHALPEGRQTLLAGRHIRTD